MEEKLSGRSPCRVLAYKAYDSNPLRDLIDGMGAEAVMSRNPTRKLSIPYDFEAYTTAAFIPAGPPPTTITRLLCSAAGILPKTSSRPVTGCWIQEIGAPLWK